MTIESAEHPELFTQSAWLQDLARSLVRDPGEVDDIHNTALVAGWQKARRDRTPPSRSWLAGVVRNRAARGRRDGSRRAQRERRAARSEAQPSAAALAERSELERRVVNAVLSLDEPYKSTVLQRFWEDRSPKLVAAELDVPVETVRTRLKRGLAELRGKLDREFGARATWATALAEWSRPEVAAPAVASPAPWLAAIALSGVAGIAALVTYEDHAPPASELARVEPIEPEPRTHGTARAILASDPDAPADEFSTDRVTVASQSETRTESYSVDRGADVATLDHMHAIIAAQTRFQSDAMLDRDSDASGEFGYFAELLGLILDSNTPPNKAGFLRRNRALGRFEDGLLLHEGYCYRMHLPSSAGIPIAEFLDGGPSAPFPEADLAEQFWCVYAWPESREGAAARPVFFADHTGEVRVTPNTGGRYAGRLGGPTPNAVYLPEQPGRIDADKSSGSGAPGRDGQPWFLATVAEGTTSLRVFDGSGATVQGVAIQVVSPPPGWRRESQFAHVVAEQRAGLDAVGAPTLAIGNGESNEEGATSIRGRLVSDAVIAIMRPQDEVPCFPHRFWLDENTLCAEWTEPAAEVVAEARANANESAAIATLKNIASAQAQCQASGVIDVDGDGAGEYGYFAELSGAITLRGSDKRMAPPVLSHAFSHLQSEPQPRHGIVVRSGYCFQLWLPDSAGQALPEAVDGGASAMAPNADMSERLFCAYAWPVDFGKSGSRCFFISQSGDVLGATNEQTRYSGPLAGPRATAAYDAVSGGRMTDDAAANETGLDGQKWWVVN